MERICKADQRGEICAVCLQPPEYHREISDFRYQARGYPFLRKPLQRERVGQEPVSRHPDALEGVRKTVQSKGEGGGTGKYDRARRERLWFQLQGICPEYPNHAPDAPAKLFPSDKGECPFHGRQEQSFYRSPQPGLTRDLYETGRGASRLSYPIYLTEN